MSYINNGDSALNIREKLNSGLLVPAEASRSLNTVNITAPEDVKCIYFKAPANFSKSDSYYINGTKYTLKNQYNVTPVSAWKQGAFVVFFLDDGNVAYVDDTPSYTKDETLLSSTLSLYGLSTSSVPDTVFRKIPELINKRALITTGTYVGNDTFGKENPNELTFPFEPYLIAIYDPESSNPSFIIRGYDKFYTWTTNCGGGKIIVEFSGKKIKWYCQDRFKWEFNGSTTYYESEPYCQLNRKNTTYYYFAIGL